eukprot:EG_transcript_10938
MAPAPLLAPCLAPLLGQGAAVEAEPHPSRLAMTGLRLGAFLLATAGTLLLLPAALGPELYASLRPAVVPVPRPPTAGVPHRAVRRRPSSVSSALDPAAGSPATASMLPVAGQRAAAPVLEKPPGSGDPLPLVELALLRQRVEGAAAAHGVTFTAQDLWRFWKSSKGRPEAAARALLGYAEWRAKSPQYGVDSVAAITAETVPREIQSGEFSATSAQGHPTLADTRLSEAASPPPGKAYVLPELHPSGKPVIVFHARLHQPKAAGYDADESLRFMVYIMERAIARMKGDIYQMMFIIDLSGLRLQNLDYAFIRRFAKVLLTRYPERLGNAVLLNAPFFFHSSWPLIKQILLPETARKFSFASSPSQLAQLFPLEMLPAAIGGTFPHAYSPDWLRA